MIFVILGIERFPFDRLVKEVDALAGSKAFDGPVFVQLGSCKYEPVNCEWKRFMDFGEVCRRMDEAALIIAHAGAGTVLLCIQRGKKPIIMPRLQRFREHVDDHQVAFARKMLELGKTDVAFETMELAGLIRGRMEDKSRNILPPQRGSSGLVSYLNSLLKGRESD